MTGQLCACLPACKRSLLASISRGGKGPIELHEWWFICHFQLPPPFKSICRLTAAGLPAPSFTGHWHHLPQPVGSALGLTEKTLSSLRPGHGRLANEEWKVPKAQSEEGCEMRVDNVPKGLKFFKKEEKDHWITAFKWYCCCFYYASFE